MSEKFFICQRAVCCSQKATAKREKKTRFVLLQIFKKFQKKSKQNRFQINKKSSTESF